VILITGGLGLIGIHLAREFLDAGEDVVLTQHRLRNTPHFIEAELGKRAFVEQLDVTDNDKLLDIGRRYKITGVCHLAGPGYNAPTAADDFRVNVFGLLNVMEAARIWEVKRLTLASSIAVYYYGGVEKGPFTEDMRLRVGSATNPIETYKKAEEVMSSHYAQRTGLSIASMRIALIYGPLHIYGNIAARFARAAADRQLPKLDSDTFEEDSTDLCYITDCVRAIRLLQTADKLSHHVYNIGDGKTTTNRMLADAVDRLEPGLNTAQVLKQGRGPSFQESRYMDLSRIKADTGYEPEYSLERGLADYISWLRAGHEV
jgi:UDP-glucose 4-epimerase